MSFVLNLKLLIYDSHEWEKANSTEPQVIIVT